jgi:Protein of unknown function (DUF541)
MQKALFLSILWAGAGWAQSNLDANSIVVTVSRTTVLAPTDATFLINVSADITVPIDQVLAAVDFGLTMSDIVSIGAYPMYPPYGGGVSPSQVNYGLRLNVAISQIKDTIDKLEKLRKGTPSGIDLSYSTSGIGPNQAAMDAAHEKALPDLMADARKRAQSIASAAQLKVGGIQGVNESYYFPAGYSGPVQPVVTFTAMVRFAAQ